MSDTSALRAETVMEAQHGTRIDMTIRVSRFHLPPVQSALVVGKKTGIGSRAITKALEEMMPGQYDRLEVEHPTIEAIVVRTAHLRRVPADKLVPVLIRHAESMMSEQDMLHFDISIEVLIREQIEL